MKQGPTYSFLRYCAVKLVPGAVLVNFLINFVVGWLIYGRQKVILLEGPTSVSTDSILGTFLICFFTFLLVMPVTRREAKAGRLPGGGGKGLFAWSEAHPGWSAFWFGGILTAVLAGVALAGIFKEYPNGMDSQSFVWFKGIFSAIVGAVSSIAAGYMGAKGGPVFREDPRWCQKPNPETDGIVYPCDYIDKGGIGVTHREYGCSGTPTWQLVVKGSLDVEHVKTALADTVSRYPSLKTVAQSLDAYPEYATHFRYAEDPNFDLESIFEVSDLREASEKEFPLLLQEVLNRHTDQFVDPPMTLTMVRTEDEEYRLLFRQHHGIADGRAFIELLTDFCTYLAAAQKGERPSDELLEPIHRKPELDALGLDKKKQSSYTLSGLIWFLKGAVKHFINPPTPLYQNDVNDYRGGNNTLHYVLSDEILERWRPIRKEMGASLNSLLAAGMFEANRRWHEELDRPVGKIIGSMVMETRPRDGSFRSFANHLSTLEAVFDLREKQSIPEMARSVQKQVVEQRDNDIPFKRLLAEQSLLQRLPMDMLHSYIFKSKRAKSNLNFSNLIGLKIPDLKGESWSVDEILITTPITPRYGIVLTVIRFNGKLIFNINYKEGAVTREEAETFWKHFSQSLEDATEEAMAYLPSAKVEVPAILPEEVEQKAEKKPLFERLGIPVFLARPKLGLKLSFIAILLTLCTLSAGLVLDDQLQFLKVDGRKSPHYSDKRYLDLFHFISDDNRKAMLESGAYPWWSAPKIQLAFFRPLSSATHWMDYSFWPDSPVMMHVHSLLWLAFLILMVTWLYRKFITAPWIAGLAALLYALDEAHGLAVGFLANRNALIATGIGVFVLILHDKWRRDDWKVGAVLGPLFMGVGLLAAEFAIFATAYLFAYSAFLDKARSWKRWLPLIPYATVVVVWRVVYKALGYGALQSGAYIDPLGEPSRFFFAVLERFPTLLLAQWTPMSADFWMTNSNAYNMGHAIFGTCVLSFIALIIFPILRKDKTAQFWTVGMLLSVLPVCATFPHDRILFGMGIGAMGVMAQFIGRVFQHISATGESGKRSQSGFTWPIRGLCGFLIVSHVFLAPLFLPLKAFSPYFLSKLEARSFSSLPQTKELPKKKVCLIHTPGFFAHTMYAMYALRGMPQPNVLRQLSITLESMKVTRVDSRTLRLEVHQGLVDRSTRVLVRSDSLSFKVGQIFKHPDVTVTVDKLGVSGHPSTATFRFNHSLENKEYVWMVWKGTKFVNFIPPAVGKTVKLDRISMVEIFW